jgi:hypothetical protein
MSTLAIPLPAAVCTAFLRRKEVGGILGWKLEEKTIQLSMIEFAYHSTYYLKL